MTVGVIGGGIQGCLAAIDLAERGYDIVLIERRDQLLQAASRWNEGKIHLGYLFANDPSLRTARRMIGGALTFAPLLSRYLGRSLEFASQSSDVIYGIHRDSQLPLETVREHVDAVDRLAREALSQPGRDYLGTKRLPPITAIQPAETGIDESNVIATIRTPERSIHPFDLAEVVAQRVHATPQIEVQVGRGVVRAERDDQGCFWLHDEFGERLGPFDAVVNATWEVRMAIDRTLGYEPPMPWLHRFKLALHGADIGGSKDTPTLTLVLGAFGDVVNYGDGRVYLSWYPAGHITSTTALAPDQLEPDIGADIGAAIRREILVRLAEIVPAVRQFDASEQGYELRGGYITAWGNTDIVDPESGLHKRHAIGVHSDRGYHSVDTGKFTMAPLNASIVGRRVAGEE
jgi:glycine/D-amino acid oxidase-like deaminating enzyme